MHRWSSKRGEAEEPVFTHRRLYSKERFLGLVLPVAERHDDAQRRNSHTSGFQVRLVEGKKKSFAGISQFHSARIKIVNLQAAYDEKKSSAFERPAKKNKNKKSTLSRVLGDTLIKYPDPDFHTKVTQKIKIPPLTL